MGPEPPPDQDDVVATTSGTTADGVRPIPPRVGSYRLQRRVGQGGMGEVWLAEQQQPVRREVAIKIVKVGMDTEEVIARFEAERQALALMNHQNIADVYDAGATAEGRPYFAMEYVHGIPITEYCDKHRLGIRERLELFVDVCAGVQHAHQKGIIHRDIKPSNILVTTQDDRHTPKIIDFGVAKATSQRLTERSVFTELGQMIGTPEYMITMKALEKDRVRRYETAHALALDVQRHLNDEPVLAGPPSGLYRLRKLVRRHRVTFVAAGVVVVAMAIGVIGTSWALLQAVRAERQAAASAVEARRQTAIAQAVNAFLNEDLLAVARPSAARGQGRGVSMREVLDVAAERIDVASKPGGRFAGEPLVEAQIRSTLGETYMHLGEYAAAEPQATRALAVRRGALGDEHDATVRMMNLLGLIQWRQSRLDAAAPLFQHAAEISRRVLGQEHATTLIYEMNLANVYRAKGRYTEAEPLYEHLIATQARVLGDEHVDTLYTKGNYANLLQETGRYERSAALHRECVDIGRRVQGEKAPFTVTETNNLANALASMGRYDEAVPLMQRALDLKIDVFGEAHPTTLNSVDSLAVYFDEMGKPAEAELLLRRALDGRTRALGLRHRQTIDSQQHLSDTLSALRRFPEAERLAAAAATQAAETLGDRHYTTLAAHDSRARALLGLQRAGDAEPILRRQLAILEEKKRQGEDAGEGDELAGKVRVHLGMALASQGRRPEAEALLVEGVPQLPARTAATRSALQFVDDFYEEWNRLQPDPDRAARAADWRLRLVGATRR